MGEFAPTSALMQVDPCGRRGYAQRSLTSPAVLPNIASLSDCPAVNFSSLYAPIDADMRAVDLVIRTCLQSEVVLIRQVAEYIISAGGKRMRPALVLLAARACGYSGTQHHELAAVIEFIHTATLLHDDVVDESALRRGRDTANAIFGSAASVLVGDFLYSRAFQMMVRVSDMRIMQVLADATNVVAEGEVLQLMNCGNADLSVTDYLRVIHYKTAKLFEAAARLGAILGNAGTDTEEAMAAYGMHIGTAFQLIDDVLDYSGKEAETGKHLGDDLAEGKTTLPLIHVMRNGSPEQAALVRNAIENADRENFPAVLSAVRSSGALEVARQHGIAEAEAAKASLAPLPDSKFRQTLIQFADFAVQRGF